MSNGEDMLSQDEIDALLNEKDEDDLDNEELTEKEKDILGEIGNIAMGSAATALYNLLGQDVNITTPKVEVTTFNQLSDEYNRPCVVVKVDYIEGLKGLNILVINEDDAKVIADLMMGGDGTNKDIELDEIHISAVGEAMNQMMGSSSTSMSSIIDEIVNISPPEPKYLSLDSVIEEDEKDLDKKEKVISIAFRLQIGDLIDSNFKLIMTKKFTKNLISRLTNSESGLTAKSSDKEKTEEIDRAKEKSTESSIKEESNQINDDKVKSQEVSSKKVQKEEVGVKTAQFPDFDNNQEKKIPKNMELIKDVPLQLTVRLGKAKMKIREILELGEGSIIELDKLAGEPVDLFVNGKLIAKGEVVVIDESFGFRVKDIVEPMERINNI